MSDDRIERRDAFGEPYELLTGAALRHELGSTMKTGAVAGILSDSCLPSFTEEQAIEAALFLFHAAKVDIVGAARKVVETRDAVRTCPRLGDDRPWLKARDEADSVLDTLATVLAKLEGGA
jgi:hypothetical protein